MPAVYAQMSTVFVEQVSRTSPMLCCLCQSKNDVIAPFESLVERAYTKDDCVYSARLVSLEKF